jgi:hypothetical protein
MKKLLFVLALGATIVACDDAKSGAASGDQPKTDSTVTPKTDSSTMPKVDSTTTMPKVDSLATKTATDVKGAVKEGAAKVDSVMKK